MPDVIFGSLAWDSCWTERPRAVLEYTLLEALLRHASTQELTDIAVGEGMRTLIAEGMRTLIEGQTTLEEVFRVTLSVL